MRESEIVCPCFSALEEIREKGCRSRRFGLESAATWKGQVRIKAASAVLLWKGIADSWTVCHIQEKRCILQRRREKENACQSWCDRANVWERVGQGCGGCWRDVDRLWHSRFSSLHQLTAAPSSSFMCHRKKKSGLKMKDPSVDLTQLLMSCAYIFHHLQCICKYERPCRSIADEKECVQKAESSPALHITQTRHHNHHQVLHHSCEIARRSSVTHGCRVYFSFTGSCVYFFRC